MAFRPAPWLRGRHLQTIYAPLLRRAPRVALTRERWELPDGDFLDLDWLAGASADSPLVVALHGLEGHSRSAYMLGALREAQRRGFAACALNFRSCSGEPNRLLRSYHSGDTGDLRALLLRLRREQPERRLLLLGFSLGANVMLKYLGEEGEAARPQIRAAAAVSPPFDLAACAGALDADSTMARIYRTRFLRTLRRKALEKARRFPSASALQRAGAARTIYAYDDLVQGPVHGFAGADDYYARSSSGPLLPQIRVPTLLLLALDDPFIPASCVPHQAIAQNPLLQLELEAAGGHVGFVTGAPWAPRFHAEERALLFLAQTP